VRAVSTSAPGKLVVLGEYSVLFGHPAVVMAVDRRARVELRPADGDAWLVTAPGFQDEAAAFDLDQNDGFRWREPSGEAARRLALVERVISSLVSSGLVDPGVLQPASLRLDTREFFQPVARGMAKLGLGSSAALTVALTEALRCSTPAGERPFELDLARLLELHRSFQGGRGSGIDLAASLLGGLEEYRLTGGDQAPSAAALDLPTNLHPVFVWTGRSASTGEFLARLDEGMTRDDGAIVSALGTLGRIAVRGTAHLRAGDITEFLDDVDIFGAAMGRLGRAAGIPIFSQEHQELGRLARGCGVAYKPSGAGGGDIGIGFTDDPEAVARFARSAADAGFLTLDLQVDPLGVDSNPVRIPGTTTDA
jgi:phosphomevalonate kinase